MTTDLTNQLAKSTSPYLQQHRDNPVHWQMWGPNALQAARDLNRPILLSIGYAACHWCHVMAHESFENPDIAAVMNELFVNIKVDREERPDIDSIYMTALHMMGEQGGWPLTMFLTPDGAPFWGGTYFPPEPRYGRPGFVQVLQRIRQVYDTEQEVVDKNTAALVNGLFAHNALEAGTLPPPEFLLQVADSVLPQIDMKDGGLSGAPKFPNTAILNILWRTHLKTGEAAYGKAVTLSLRRMCEGGIYDHLGGGFARYSVDAQWLVPHFEKMLYDNALLVDLLTDAWRHSGDELFARRVDETIGWLQREMIAANGAFAASLDADSEGEEGKFYVWSPEDVRHVLGDDADFFMAAYDITEAGNFEGHNIPNRLHWTRDISADDESRLKILRQKLLAARAARVRPGWDDKVLADWNGLMIHALAEASAAFRRDDWLALAEQAFASIVRDLSTENGRLLHAWRDGKAQHTGMLDDYAFMARAAMALFQVTQKNSYLQQARDWVAVADTYFWDDDSGGYFFTADDAEALIVRSKTASDSATLSGNAVMLEVLSKLALLTDNPQYGQRADELLTAFADTLQRQPLGAAALLGAYQTRVEPVSVVLIGDDVAALRQTVFTAACADRVLQVIADGAALPAGHPATGKTQVDNKPTAYVCRGQTCSLPATAADDLKQLLRGA